MGSPLLVQDSGASKDQNVRRFDVKPKFRAVDGVGRHGISGNHILHLNQRGYFERVPFAFCRAELGVELVLSGYAEVDAWT
jgi:hypothetical protein